MDLRKVILSIPIALLCVTPAFAQGVSCKSADQSKWRSKSEFTKALSSQGWNIDFMKPDNGCWKVFGRSPDGQRAEAYFDPITGEKLMVSQFGKVVFRKK